MINVKAILAAVLIATATTPAVAAPVATDAMVLQQLHEELDGIHNARLDVTLMNGGEFWVTAFDVMEDEYTKTLAMFDREFK